MEKNRIYTVYAGVNGAGKSTLYKTMGCVGDDNRVNSDEILVASGGDWRNKTQQLSAMREAVIKINYYLKEGVSFNQETTLAGNANFIKKAKEQGFIVHLVYVGLESADLAVQRVEKRVREGGHGVEEEVIRRRYEASLAMLKKVLPMCEYVDIYDNTEKYKLVATCDEGNWTIYRNGCGWFQRALQDVYSGNF